MADPVPVIPNVGRTVWLPSGSGGIFGPFGQAFVLFQTDVDITLASEWPDFVEADFSGYARVNITLGPTFVNGDNLLEQDWSPAVWAHDGGGVGNLIYGWLLLRDPDGGTPIIMAGQNFDPPRSMSVITDSIPVIVNSLFDPAV